MAIKPSDLNHLMPSSGAERLKAKKNRIRPWQAPSESSPIEPDGESVRGDVSVNTPHNAASDARGAADTTSAEGKSQPVENSVRSGISQLSALESPTLNSSEGLSPSIARAESVDPAQNTIISNTEVETISTLNLGQTSDNSRTNLGHEQIEIASTGNEVTESNLGQSSDKIRTNLGQPSAEINQDASTVEVANDVDIPLSAIDSSKPRTNLGQEFDSSSSAEDITALERLDHKAANLGQTSDNSRTNLGHESSRANGFTSTAKTEASTVDGNLGQTTDNPKTTLRTNVGQSQDKPKTVAKAKPRTNPLTSDKPRTEPRTKEEPNLGQSSDKPRTVSTLQALSGLQQNIAHMMYQLCCEKGGRVTGPVSIEFLIAQLGSTRLSIQKTIQRLENKQILIRLESKSGRGGWTVYEIPNVIWNEFRQTENIAKLRTNLGQTSDNPRSQPRTEPRTNVSSKLVSDLNNNLLTSKPSVAVESLRLLELESVSKFGITQKHIQDIRNQKIEIPYLEFQSFITRFSIYASDTKNVRTVKSLPALFVSMVQSLSRGDDPLSGIETPEEQLVQKLLEERKAQLERKKAAERELENFEFESWFEGLSEKSKTELVPESAFAKIGTHAHKMLMLEFFKTNVWNSIREKLVADLKVQSTR